MCSNVLSVLVLCLLRPLLALEEVDFLLVRSGLSLSLSQFPGQLARGRVPITARQWQSLRVQKGGVIIVLSVSSLSLWKEV